jgi:hypothetical protein
LRPRLVGDLYFGGMEPYDAGIMQPMHWAKLVFVHPFSSCLHCRFWQNVASTATLALHPLHYGSLKQMQRAVLVDAR